METALDFSLKPRLSVPAPAPRAPTIEEREEIWSAAVDAYQAGIMNGEQPWKVSRAIAAETVRRFPQLCSSTDAAYRQLYRKIKRTITEGHVRDLRPISNKNKHFSGLSDADRKPFLRALIFRHYGDMDKAWSECLRTKQFSKELLARYSINPNGRTRCPKTINRQFPRRLVNRMLAIAHRPRKARQSGPYIICRHDDYHAGDWFTSDDFTLELYYAPPPDDPTMLRRGQFFPVADCRSKRILIPGLVDAEGYRQDEVRIALKRACTAYGIPRVGIHVENGNWKRGKLLGGKTFDSESEVRRNFAQRLGIRLVNSMPASPRGKIIENIGKLLQGHIRGELRWVGPDEKKLVFEHSQEAIRDVTSGRKTAAEAGFLSREEWFAKLRDEIVPEYNATKQVSKVMGGDREVYMSPDQAWEELQPRDANGVIGMDYLPDELQWLLDHREVVKVGRNGIALPYCGGLNYKGGDSGRFIGSDVIAYFDPEKKDLLHISDLKQEQWGIVPLDSNVPRWTATREELAEAHSRIKGHDSYSRMLVGEIKSIYKAPRRQLVADAKALEIGRKMKAADSEWRGRTKVESAERAAHDETKLEERERNTVLNFLDLI